MLFKFGFGLPFVHERHKGRHVEGLEVSNASNNIDLSEGKS